MAERFGQGATLLGNFINAADGRKGFVQQVEVVDGTGGGTAQASTATVTSVASAAVSTTLLAANTARRGATITNTDANALLVNLAGGVASASAYSVRIAQNDSYQVPFGYTGAITGIWELDGAGVALITQFT